MSDFAFRIIIIIIFICSK